jgi:hypothetical protein
VPPFSRRQTFTTSSPIHIFADPVSHLHHIFADHYGRVLVYASAELQADREVVLAAVQQHMGSSA